MKKLSLGLLVLLATLLIQHRAGGTTYIIFRYDDFAGDAPGIREADVFRRQIWEAEQAVDRLFQRYGFSYTIAIIPNRNGVPLGADAEKTEFIKNAVSAGKVEVAQHGFTHTSHAGVNHRPGEFRDRDYQSQFQDIKRGREILLSALGLNDIDVFVPPWNGWTYDTGKVVEELGFKIFSADCYYYYDSIKKIVSIPYTSGLQGLESMLGSNGLRDGSVVVVLYHPRQIVKFPGEDGSRYFGIERFDKLLQTLSVLPNVEVGTLSSLCGKSTDFTAERYFFSNRMYRLQSFWVSLLPSRLLPGGGQNLAYLSVQEYSQIIRPWYYLTAAFIGVIAAAGFLFRLFSGWRLSAKWRVRMYIFAAILLFISILAELRLLQRGYHMTGIRMIPALLGGGFLLGFFLDLVKKTLCRGSATNRD